MRPTNTKIAIPMLLLIAFSRPTNERDFPPSRVIRAVAGYGTEHLIALKQAVDAFDFCGTQLAECDAQIHPKFSISPHPAGDVW